MVHICNQINGYLQFFGVGYLPSKSSNEKMASLMDECPRFDGTGIARRAAASALAFSTSSCQITTTKKLLREISRMVAKNTADGGTKRWSPTRTHLMQDTRHVNARIKARTSTHTYIHKA